MSNSLDQRSYWVVRFETTFASLDEVRQNAPEALASHMQRSMQLHAAGQLLMAGAFLTTSEEQPDQPLTTMAVLVSREAAQDYVDHDPFVQNGTVSSYQILEWNNMFA